MAVQGGPAMNVVVDPSRARAGGPALPVAVVTDGRATEGNNAIAVYEAPAGTPVIAGPALPIVVAPAGSRVEAGPAIPVRVVAGSLGSTVAPPVNTVAPSISGMPWSGATLTGTHGTYTGSPTSYTYRWLRNGVAIGSATAQTYVLVSADAGTTITFEETPTGAGGTGAPATSAGFAVVAGVTQAWYKADSLSLNNNDPVGTWTDSSGNSRDATQGTASLKPLFQANQVNGLPGVLFDGTDDYLASATFTLNQPVTLVAVMRLPATTAGRYMWDGSANNFCGFRQATAGSGRMNAGSDLPDITLGTTNAHIVCAVYNGASSRNRLDAGVAVTGDVGANAMGQISLGIRGNKAGGQCNVLFCEFLAFNSALSTSDETLVRSALNSRYAIF